MPFCPDLSKGDGCTPSSLECFRLADYAQSQRKDVSANIMYCSCRPYLAIITGTGLNAKGKKTLAHPDYHLIQAWWHPTLNKGKQPADFPHKTRQRVWLCCPGCTHGCGRQHQWEASIRNLTRGGGSLRCPYCESRGRGGSSCECRSVAEDARLSREWHPDNPTPPHPGGQEQRQEIPVDVSQGS